MGMSGDLPAPAPSTVAAMQPYLFPYLGYFQLIAHADRFVVGDDFPWVRGGWINRNRVLERGSITMFTVPVVAAPAEQPIGQRRLTDEYPEYRRRLIARLRHGYARAPHADEVLPLLDEWLLRDEQDLLAVVLHALRGVCAHLGITTPVLLSSERPTTSSRGIERVIRLVRAFDGTRFLNPPGGRAIYQRAAFAAGGLELAFLDPELPPYVQLGGGPFVPGLSILDVLFNVPREQARALVLRGRETPAT
jgi:hypothetical protein